MATYPKGKKFVTKFMVNGERYVRMTSSREAGEAWELAARAAIKLGKPIPEPEGIAPARKLGGKDTDTLANVLRSAETLHWSALRTEGKKASLNARIFVNWAGPNVSPKEAFKQESIRAFIRYLTEERKVSNSTKNRYMSAVSVLIKHADLDKRPELPWFKAGPARVRYFSVEEERAVIALLTQWGREKERDFFMFLIDTGLRTWKEAGALGWREVKRDRVTVLGKNGQYRDVPLTKRARLVLDRQSKKEAGPFTSLNQFGTIGLWDRVRQHIKGMEDTVLYTARHTFASRLVMKGVPLKAVADLMGNSATIVDKVYAHLAPDYLAGVIDVLDDFGEGQRANLALVSDA